MPIKSLKWTTSDGKQYDLPTLWKGFLENMSNATILQNITPEYDFSGGGSIQVKINVLTGEIDYYGTTDYGKRDFIELNLESPKKIAEKFPVWDSISDYRDINYWEQKFAEWGKSVGRIRERRYFDVLNADVSNTSATKVSYTNGSEMVEAIIDDALKIHQIKNAHHDGIPKEFIRVVVNVKTAKAIRAALVELDAATSSLFGVLPIGVYNGITFFESAFMDDSVPYYVMAITATAVGFVPGTPEIDTPIEGTADRIKGIHYRYAQGVIQPDLIIKGQLATSTKAKA